MCRFARPCEGELGTTEDGCQRLWKDEQLRSIEHLEDKNEEIFEVTGVHKIIVNSPHFYHPVTKEYGKSDSGVHI